MYALKTYEQTGVYDPTNPDQRIREVYAGNPGQWASYYWNVVPNPGELRGLGVGWAKIPAWGQIGIVGAIGAAIGFFGWKKYGAALKPKLRKLPIIGGAFAGLGVHRRR